MSGISPADFSEALKKESVPVPLGIPQYIVSALDPEWVIFRLRPRASALRCRAKTFVIRNFKPASVYSTISHRFGSAKLEINQNDGTILNNPAAAKYWKREYRSPYVVPENV